MSITIIGVAASPRELSNSKILLEESLSSLAKVVGKDLSYDIINLRELDINPCLACKVCGKTKDGKFMPCVQEDDMPELHQKLLAADGIILSTPVYFGLPSDLYFKFINRTRVLRHQNFRLANKPVGVMAVAGRRGGGGEITATAAWNAFLRNGCLPVGNGGGTSQYGAIGWATRAGTIVHDTWGIKQGEQLAQRVYSLAKVIKVGLEATDYAFPMKFSDEDGKPEFEL